MMECWAGKVIDPSCQQSSRIQWNYRLALDFSHGERGWVRFLLHQLLVFLPAAATAARASADKPLEATQVTAGSSKGAPMPRPESLDHPLLAGIVTLLRAAGCVFAEEEAQLLLSEAAGPAELTEWIGRRVSGEPLEYIVGWAAFCGLRVAVDPGVFVPRRRTELVVAEAVALLRHRRAAGAGTGVVVDLCCGSGAVGVAVASHVPVKELHAADLDSVAVECARRNLASVGGEAHSGDLYAALPSQLRGRVQLLVVNAPYVPTDVLPTMPAEARIYEPRISLDGGPDGLDLHRRIIAEAPEWLDPRGHVVIETSGRQAAGTSAIMADAGLAARTVHSEELDGTVVVGTLRSR